MASNDERKRMMRRARQLAARERQHQKGIAFAEALSELYPGARVAGITIKPPDWNETDEYLATVNLIAAGRRVRLRGTGVTAFHAQMDALGAEWPVVAEEPG